MTLTVSQGRAAGHRPAALPRRLRAPGRAARRRPRLPARPPGRRARRRQDQARPDRHVLRRGAVGREPTGCSWTSSTRAWSAPPSSPCTRPHPEVSDDRRADPHAAGDRAGHRRHDLRVVREPDREEAEQARRRHRDRQLRHREGQGHLRRRRRPRPRSSRRSRPPATPPRCRSRERRPRRRGRADDPIRAAAAPADRLARAGGAGDRAGDGPGAAVHLLAVALADAGRAGRGVGGVAVPPGRVDEPAARRGHHGHADLDGHARRVRLVAVRAVLRRRGRCRA